MANFKMGSQTVFTQTDDSTPVFDTSVKYTAGEVVQIKYKQLTTRVDSANTLTHNPDMDVTITPKFSNSVILYEVYAKTEANQGATGQIGYTHKIERVVGGVGTNIDGAAWHTYLNDNDGGTQGFSSDHYIPFTTKSIDTPNTTSTITYKFYLSKYHENSSLNVWKIGALNAEGSTFGGNIQNYAQRGVVTVTEIKQ